MRIRTFAVLILASLSSIALIACPASLDERCADEACSSRVGQEETSSGNGGEAGDTNVPDAPKPTECNEDADAKDSLECAVNKFALFVDGKDGADTNDGSREKPFQSITKALNSLDGRRRIYICGSPTLNEHVEQGGNVYAHLFGGFTCGTWLSDPASKPRVAPTTAGYALHITNVTGPIRVEDVAFEAIAGTQPSKSSIAVFVVSSPSVSFKRSELKANAGFKGDDGVQGVTGSVAGGGNLIGNSTTTTTGADPKVCTCSTGGSSTGGRGGDAIGAAIDGAKGEDHNLPPSPTAAEDGAGQTQSTCNAAGAGAHKGATASASPDAPKPASAGVFNEMGWSPTLGQNGSVGKMGQGGGGGGGRNNTATNNGGGGSGGCGGCGGEAGTGGSGGGASVALLAFGSPVRVIASTLSTMNGGDGGLGKSGGPGGTGGDPGAGLNLGCGGNFGGAGGAGGAGAGGAGGVSAAIFHKGGAPTNDGSTLSNGKMGQVGAGGKTPDNDGHVGLEGQIVAAP